MQNEPLRWPGSNIALTDMEERDVRALWQAGCKCPFPLLGQLPEEEGKITARCRLCNTEAAVKVSPRLYHMVEGPDGFGCFCVDTHSMIAAGPTENEARDRASARGWNERTEDEQ